MDAIARPPQRYSVGGMTCGACARHVEAALQDVPGVRAAHVDYAAAVAIVEADDNPLAFPSLRQAVDKAGYTLDKVPRAVPAWSVPVRAIVVGVLAAASLLTLYLGLITLAQGWTHAIQQLDQDRWFVGAIAAGFGTQVGLFFYVRSLHGAALPGGVVASTGTSSVAMLACCAHHVTDVLPILRLAGAAVFLNIYKTPLLWLGIVMNAAGIAYMLWQIRRQRAMDCALPVVHDNEPALAQRGGSL